MVYTQCYTRDELDKMANEQVAQAQKDEKRWYDGRCRGRLHLVFWEICASRLSDTIDLDVTIACDEPNVDHAITTSVELWS